MDACSVVENLKNDFHKKMYKTANHDSPQNYSICKGLLWLKIRVNRSREPKRRFRVLQFFRQFPSPADAGALLK